MTIKDLRAATGLSQVKFGKKYGIPTRTVEDWEASRRKPPQYVIDLLEFKIKKEG